MTGYTEGQKRVIESLRRAEAQPYHIYAARRGAPEAQKKRLPKLSVGDETTVGIRKLQITHETARLLDLVWTAARRVEDDSLACSTLEAIISCILYQEWFPADFGYLSGGPTKDRCELAHLDARLELSEPMFRAWLVNNVHGFSMPMQANISSTFCADVTRIVSGCT